jgi:hypothetical protein
MNEYLGNEVGPRGKFGLMHQLLEAIHLGANIGENSMRSYSKKMRPGPGEKLFV